MARIAQGVGQALLGGVRDRSRHRASCWPARSWITPCRAPDDLPSFRTEIVEVLSPTNPLGIKAGGEGGTTPALAVVVERHSRCAGAAGRARHPDAGDSLHDLAAPSKTRQHRADGPSPFGARFAVALAAVTLIGPLAVHLFLPVVPAVKGEFGVSDALAELSFSVTLAAMALATLVYGSLVATGSGGGRVLLSGLGLFLAGSVTLGARRLGRGADRGAAGAGGGRRLQHHADPRHRARRLWRRASGQGDRLSHHGLYAGADGGAGGGRAISPIISAGAACSGSRSRPAARSPSRPRLVLHETRRGAGPRRSGILRDYGVLLADPRFAAFVLQSGFCSGTFFAMAAASPFLMQGALGRSATAFGLYFFCYPAGYCIGNLISSRVAGRVSIETMVLTGSLVNLAAVGVQAGFVVGGTLSPLVIFLPGAFVTFAQGLALPNAQAGAMQVRPDLAGTAAGMGVFVQTLFMALFAQLYGSLADGTAYPMVAVAALAAVSSAVCGAVPLLLQRRPVPDRI